MVRRGFHRSAKTPATGPSTIPGASEASSTPLISRAEPCIRNTIATCTAKIATKSRSRLMVCASHRRWKGVTLQVFAGDFALEPQRTTQVREARGFGVRATCDYWPVNEIVRTEGGLFS